MDGALQQAYAKERPQCRRVPKVCNQCLAKMTKVLIRLVDSAALTYVTRDKSDDVCEFLHHRACQHVGRALVLVADLAPCADLDAQQDAAQFGTLVVVIVNCSEQPLMVRNFLKVYGAWLLFFCFSKNK